ncbi:hypothetical protein VHEMI04162 [[Torrubiella] hemipterigena]|uniref:Carrier domain-containing protein n=1 Tax=[Torrubiella] hemipterigena TaxID=1531966 RepID=A0A0A1T0I8_9HYPO|nr:hypothetical protein VHEMI04162 [[Torrubiella] hemipterigena]
MVAIHSTQDDSYPSPIVNNSVNGNGMYANGTTNGNVHSNGIMNGQATQNDATQNGESIFSPIAICGMACRLPGGIASPEQLWEFLLEGGDARTRVPKSRFNIDAYHSSTKKPGATITEYGYFLDEDVDIGALDISFFSMPRNEVARLDPQQRLLLEVARESIDDAGEVGWKGSNIGVYVGTFSQDWYDAFNKDSSKYGIYQATATHDFMVSERLSHEMDLRGPSMTIRTACSSAFVGLNEACMSIARGDCKSAIVGGSSIIMAPSLMAAMSEQGVLSPDGSCKTFSAAANGYARGEAIVSFYVKSLDAAIADGNPIRAVIAGTSTNFDGKTPTLSMPNPEAQEALIRQAYKVAGISDFAKTGFFECHGTGTSAGDLVETSAVAAVFGQDGVHIGSVKPNLGHSEGASGLTSLLKAVLALEHKTIPPNIKSLPLNPKIPFEDKKLTVPHEAKDWPADRDERVSINSFGVGGANAHVIVESAARYRTNPNPEPLHGIRASDSKPQLMVYSANTAQSLKDLVQIHRSFLGKTELDYEDIALTLATRREHLGHRSFAVVTKNTFDAAVELPVQDAGKAGQAAPSLVMVFTGQGAAWPRFGRELLLTNPIFANSVKSLDAQLQTLGKIAPSWSLVDELCKPAKTSRVYEAEFSQPLCTAVQIALLDLFASLGVTPAAVVGHSSGEIAAAYAAGGLTAYEAIVAAFLRGATTKVQTQQGGMAAVGLGWEVAKKHIAPGVVIACDNAPNSVTLSGDVDKLEQVVAAVKEAHPNVPATMLKVEKAYHSHHMELLGADYQQSMEDAGIVGRQPVIPFFSSMTGKRFGLETNDRFGPSYWRANLEKPVLFRSAVAGIVHYPEIENELFLELGPHSALAGPLRQILTHNGSNAPYVASLVRNQHSVESFLTALGKLFTHHVDVNFTTLFPRGTVVSDMPRYPWDHQRRYWHESRVSKEWRWREHPHHDLLGIRVPECTDLEPVWRNLLHIENVPWVADHRLNDGIVFPFAAYVGMAAEAARQMSGLQDGVSLRHVIVSNALLINEEAPTELVTTLRPHRLTDSLNSEFWWDFTIASHNGHVWTKHCSGEVRGESFKEVAACKVQDLPRKVDMGRWQDVLRKAGLNYGPLFTTLQDVKCTTGVGDLSATGWMENNRWGQESQYHLHPVILDSYFQLLSVARANGVAHTYRRLIAASVESLTLYRNSAPELSLAATTVSTEDGLIGHGECVADNGQAVLIASGVRISLFEEGETEEDNAMPLTARVEWVPHIDFQKTQDLIQHSGVQNDALPILTELAQTAINLSQVLIKDIEASTTALQKYKSWLLQQCTVDSLHDLDVAASFQKMQSLRHRLQGTSAAHASDAINAILNNIELVLRGEKSGFEVLNANGDLENFMTFLQECDDARYIATLAQTKPNLKVLELEAGLGAKTKSILRSLTRANDQILYSQYVFADASSGIINSAKESFKGTPNLEFVAWVVNQDAADAGFEQGQFDLIIASGVLNGTSSVQESLRNIHQLLAPEGRLLLQEPAPGLAWTKFILGALPSFWNYDLNGHAEEPFISQPRWEEELKAAGFGDIDAITSNSETASTIIVAKPQPKAIAVKKITLLTNGNAPTSIINGLESRGYEITQCTLDQTPPAGQDVLAVLDQDTPFFDNINEARFIQFKAFVNGLNGAGLLWLTKLCSVGCQDPRYGPVVGLARTLRSEMDISFAVCETESMESSSDLDSLAAILEKFQGRSQDGPMNADYEYAIYKGDVLNSRIFPFALEDEQTASSDSGKEATLSIAQQGRLDSLCWAPMTVEGLKEDEVEVEVYASGLNFRVCCLICNVTILFAPFILTY